MPYVVKHAGEYLVRPVNAGYKRKRRFSTNLGEATVWSKPGHAKNAIREIFANQPDLVSARATFEIVLVNYAEGPVAAKVTKGKTRYGGVMIKDVV